MNRTTRMIIFAAIGISMVIGLFVFSPNPASENKRAVPAVFHPGASQDLIANSVDQSSEMRDTDEADSSVSNTSFASEAPLSVGSSIRAIEPQAANIDRGGYLARIQFNAPEQVEAALRRTQLLYESGEIRPGDSPVTFVLHGPEVSIFFKENYAANKRLVDLAAKLSAFKVVDMKVCATRLGAFGETVQSLPPFVTTIPFGPAEITRLIDEENFIYF